MAAAPAPEQLHEPGLLGRAATASSVFSSPPAVRVLDTTLVHPSPPTSSGDPAPPEETSLPLTFFDVFWVPAPPVQRVFFYRLLPDADIDAVLANLKDSLSHAVRAFLPLAGRLRLTPGTANRLAADEPREAARLAPLAPPLLHAGAVLAVQATPLSVRRGLALGVTVHHAACDGAASTHFLHTWVAAACAGAGTTTPPPPAVIDRTLVSDPRGLYDVFCPPAASDALFVDRMPDDQRLATFTLSRDHLQLVVGLDLDPNPNINSHVYLQRVKDAVAAAAATRGVAPRPRCSSLVAALGFVWSCYRRAKPGGAGERACLLFFVDHRSRLKPPLPDKYFGNCVAGATAMASTCELAEAGADGGLLTACTAIAEAIEDAVSGPATQTMGEKRRRFRELAATMDVLSVE
ncbi:hypothetical protein EJB05_29281, partial [Eragrostis curvula]